MGIVPEAESLSFLTGSACAWKKGLFLSFLGGILVFGCQEEQPGLPIEREVMVQVLADVHLAEAIIQESTVNSRKDSLYDVYYQRIFSRYDISREDFDQSMEGIRRDPEALYDLYTEVLDELARRDAQIRN